MATSNNYIGGISTINSFADIATVLANSYYFNWRKLMSTNFSLDHLAIKNSILSLFDEINQFQLEYLVVGGIAMLMFIPDRNTEDIDLIVDPSLIEQIKYSEIISRDNNFCRLAYGSLTLDLLLTTNKLFKEVAQKYTILEAWHGVNIKYANPTGLTILKLYALPSLYGQGKFSKADRYKLDIKSILRQEFVDLSQVFQLLSKHLLKSDITELRKETKLIIKQIEYEKKHQTQKLENDLEIN